MGAEPIEFVTEIDGGLHIKVLLQPNAPKSEVVGVHDGRLKIKISSPPVDNAANNECIKFLSRFLHVSKSSVVLLKGERSRQKMFLVKGLSLNLFLEKLGL